MSIIYIGQSQAKTGEVDNFRNFMASVVMPAVRTSEGCESYQLFQSQADPTKFIGIEVWDSVEAHRASVKNIPAESLGEYMKLVATLPAGGYYDSVHAAE